MIFKIRFQMDVEIPTGPDEEEPEKVAELMRRFGAVRDSLKGKSFDGDLCHLADAVERLEGLAEIHRRARASYPSDE